MVWETLKHFSTHGGLICYIWYMYAYSADIVISNVVPMRLNIYRSLSLRQEQIQKLSSYLRLTWEHHQWFSFYSEGLRHCHQSRCIEPGFCPLVALGSDNAAKCLYLTVVEL